MRVAYGIEEAPKGVNELSLQITLIESLKSAGKIEQAQALARRVSLAFTKRAQDLNLAKLDVGAAGVRRIEAMIMNERLAQLGKNLPESFGESVVERGRNLVQSKAKEGAKEVRQTIQRKYPTAKELFDDLTC